jgi:hypothetical protein
MSELPAAPAPRPSPGLFGQSQEIGNGPEASAAASASAAAVAPTAGNVVVEPSIDRDAQAALPPLEGGQWPPALRRFAFFRCSDPECEGLDPPARGRLAWKRTLDDLAALAEDEEWSGANAEGRHRPILDSYLRYTYRRLVLEDKIAASADGQYAAFNTGLLTEYGEAIFGLFQRNRLEGVQPWFFIRWAIESDRDILRHFPTAPDHRTWPQRPRCRWPATPAECCCQHHSGTRHESHSAVGTRAGT